MKVGKIIGGFFCAHLLVSMIVIGGWLTVGNTVMAAGQDAPAQEGPGQLYATAAVLMDADSGRILYGKKADEPMAMASTTKIMTCILVLELGDTDEVASVSSYAASSPKVRLSMRKGECYPVKDLLYSLMLESHNDSAVVLAEHIGKQYLSGEPAEKDVAEYTVEESKQAVAAFASLMNQKAEEIGCKDTRFITPNGLDAEEAGRTHHTTAEDLAGIMRYCIKRSPEKDRFLEITGTKQYSFYANNRSFTCNNHNAFLSMMEGAFSGKTGFTNKAGYCYVGALESEGRTFVVALLACGWPNHKSYKWSDTRALMEYGTVNYVYKSLTEGTDGLWAEPVIKIPVRNGCSDILGEAAYAAVVKSETAVGLEGLLLRSDERVKVSLHMLKEIEAPVKAGTVVGYVAFSVGDVLYRVEKIEVVHTVERIGPWWCIRQVFWRFLLEKP